MGAAAAAVAPSGGNAAAAVVTAAAPPYGNDLFGSGGGDDPSLQLPNNPNSLVLDTALWKTISPDNNIFHLPAPATALPTTEYLLLCEFSTLQRNYFKSIPPLGITMVV